MQRGDILLRRYDGYVNTLFTPGFWGHAALCVSANDVIHAVGVGVVREDLMTERMDCGKRIFRESIKVSCFLQLFAPHDPPPGNTVDPVVRVF